MQGYGSSAVQAIPVTDNQPWDSVVGGALRFVYEYNHVATSDGPKMAAILVAPRVRVAFRGVTYTLVRDSLTVATGSLVMSVAVPGLGTVKFFLNAHVHPSVPVINGALTSSLALLETWDNMWAGSEAAFAAATPGAPVRFAVPRDATDKFVFQMMWRLSEWGGVLWRVGEFGL
jgi:hypothetical protein